MSMQTIGLEEGLGVGMDGWIALDHQHPLLHTQYNCSVPTAAVKRE